MKKPIEPIMPGDLVVCIKSFNGTNQNGTTTEGITLPKKNEVFEVEYTTTDGKWLYLKNINDTIEGMRVRYDSIQFRKVDEQKDFGLIVCTKIEKSFINNFYLN